MSLNLYRCTPRQARKLIIQILEVGLVPFLQSHPGIGKSSIHHLIAKDFGLHLIDHRLSTSEPTDLSGFGANNGKGRAHYLPFELFPIEGDQIPEGKNGWMLFLDEFNSAPRSVQAAAYKLILDRMVGQHRLHSNVAISTAGNLASDRAITNPLSTAMQSRLVHLEMEVNFDEWLEDVAFAQNYDPRVIAFLSQYPSKLMDFQPDHHDRTFCCPRTWEFTHRLVQGRELDNDSILLLTGTITSGVAVEFVQFCQVYKDLVTLADIRRDPRGCPIPEDLSLKYATITSMMEQVTVENFGDLAAYVSRYSLDFKVLFFKSVIHRHKHLELDTHPAFGQAMVEVSRYLYAA